MVEKRPEGFPVSEPEPDYGLRWVRDGLYWKHTPANPYMSSVTHNLRRMAGKQYGNVSDYIIYCAYYNTDVMDIELDDSEAAEERLREHLDEYLEAANRSGT